MPPSDASLLLCSDLDGTLIPDGRAPESPDARPLFRRLAAHRGVCLAYVTGRHPELAEQGLQQANLPQPQFLLGDVGSSIYQTAGGAGSPCKTISQIAPIEARRTLTQLFSGSPAQRL
jgi:hydroxymethylpyrimidine pyrophosphatase-like HAD family hydrolase